MEVRKLFHNFAKQKGDEIMEESKDIRWMQRLSNYDKAVARLQNAAKIIATEKQFSGEIDELLKEKKSQKHPHLSIIEDKNTNFHTFIHYKR